LEVLCPEHSRTILVGSLTCVKKILRVRRTNFRSSCGEKMSYQSFNGEPSDSESAIKLEKIKLPKNLEGMAVLDIGCNEGFFCLESIRRKAKRVLGADNNPALIEKARARVPDAEFVDCSWWNLPREKFDLILFLSAIHYEPEQKRLLRHLEDYLSQDGVLILECGVFPSWDVKKLNLIDRHDGIFVYPTFRLLIEDYLEGYAVRDIGPSVDQRGDPVPRFVFHCNKFRPEVILISGKSGLGKTILAREFSKLGAAVISLDFHYSQLFLENKEPKAKALKYLCDNFLHERIDEFLRKALADNMVDGLNKLILPLVSSDNRLTVIEGFQFELPEFKEKLKRSLEDRGFIVRIMQL
jgi:SAM-dependent methyltransferase